MQNWLEQQTAPLGITEEMRFMFASMKYTMEVLDAVGDGGMGWNQTSVDALKRSLERGWRKNAGAEDTQAQFMQQASAAAGEFVRIYIGGEWLKGEGRWRVRLREDRKHQKFPDEMAFPDGFVYDPYPAAFEWLAGVTDSPFAPLEAVIGPPPTKSSAKLQAMSRGGSVSKKRKR